MRIDMNFEHRDFLVVANNEALVDFSPVQEYCSNRNIIHINKAIHLESFSKYGKNNYLAMNSYLHSQFIAYGLNSNRLDLFSGVYFIMKPKNLDAPYEKFQKYIDDCNHPQKETLCIGFDPIKTIFNNGDPSAGFNIVYHLYNTYKEANITLVGFCGHHPLPNNKIALSGHPTKKEQEWYKNQPRISFLVSEPPCGESFHFPCAVCGANDFDKSKLVCIKNSNRLLLFKTVCANTNVKGVELGVAKGNFSFDLLNCYKNLTLYSIDAWAGDRGHNDNEYSVAKNKLSVFGNRSHIIRSLFSDAVSSFSDSFFDFIYIDGYAHLGQDDGKTLHEWYDKLKIGGIFSGHDYDIAWPKTVKSVDAFAAKHNKKISIINDKPYSSWYFIK